VGLVCCAEGCHTYAEGCHNTYALVSGLHLLWQHGCKVRLWDLQEASIWEIKVKQSRSKERTTLRYVRVGSYYLWMD
jgi:hypothetical protein